MIDILRFRRDRKNRALRSFYSRSDLLPLDSHKNFLVIVDAQEDRTIWKSEFMKVHKHVGHVVRLGEAVEAITWNWLLVNSRRPSDKTNWTDETE